MPICARCTRRPTNLTHSAQQRTPAPHPQAKFVHVGTNFLPADSDLSYPFFGLSLATGGSSSGSCDCRASTRDSGSCCSCLACTAVCATGSFNRRLARTTGRSVRHIRRLRNLLDSDVWCWCFNARCEWWPLRTVIVQSASSSHLFDPFVMNGGWSRIGDYTVQDQPHRVYWLGGNVPDETGTGTICGTVLDYNRRPILINLFIFIVPGLGRHL